tara:strand:- start:1423 stop:1536 length:114 start_codon:yes stop_codon:yes gene_type:complete
MLFGSSSILCRGGNAAASLYCPATDLVISKGSTSHKD